MRNLLLPAFDESRDCSPSTIDYCGDAGDQGNGLFNIASPIDGANLKVIASDGGGWDHVSVSRRNRCPNWTEMDFIKRVFFLPDEVAMQLHVAESEHLSLHPYCLHIWRPNDGSAIPLPPSIMVAPPMTAHEDATPL